MKKVSVILIALLMAATTVITAFAAGINDSEQAVLDELKKSITVNGVEMVWPDAYVNQAENFFNTIDMTEDQKTQIISIYKEGTDYFLSTGASNIPNATVAQRRQLFDILTKIMNVVDGTASYNKSAGDVSLLDKNGTVLLDVVPVLVEKSSGKAVDSDGKQIDTGVIKTTGANVNYTAIIIVSAAVAVILAGGLFFVLKKQKA